MRIFLHPFIYHFVSRALSSLADFVFKITHWYDQAEHCKPFILPLCNAFFCTQTVGIGQGEGQ